MNKREIKELAKNQLVQFYNIIGQPPDMRQDKTEAGYRYLKIIIEDSDTGEAIAQPIYTMRKDDDLQELFNHILNIARWPDELLESTNIAFFLPTDEPEMETVIEQKANALQVINSQLSGGRQNQDGISPETEEKYINIAKELMKWYKRGGTQEQYSERRNISIRTIQRAMRFYLNR